MTDELVSAAVERVGERIDAALRASDSEEAARFLLLGSGLTADEIHGLLRYANRSAAQSQAYAEMFDASPHELIVAGLLHGVALAFALTDLRHEEERDRDDLGW